MIPKGAIIGLCSGIVGAIIVGLFMANISHQTPVIVFVDGPSLSIMTEKTNYKLGEMITIKIINSGTMPLTFSDSSYGLRIVGLDGRVLYSPPSIQAISVLQPKEEKTFVWDQTKSDGDKIIEGRYKIVSNTIPDGKDEIKKSVTINVLK